MKRPIRKKGYYRAVKRGEKWAVEISKKKGFEFLFAFHFRTIDLPSLLEQSVSLLTNLAKDSWNGAYIPIPIKFDGDK